MDMDYIELLMLVEIEFGIHVTDERAQEMETVGELHDYVVDTLISTRPGVCPSMFVFYRMRRALADSLGIDRRSITPDTDLRELLRNTDQRREHWERMRDGLGLTTKPLALPEREGLIARTAQAVLLWGGAAITLAATMAFAVWGAWWLFLVGLFVGMVIAGVLLGRGFEWLHHYEQSHSTVIPEGHESPRQIIQRLVPEHEWLVRKESRAWLRRDVGERLLELVRNETPDISPEKVSFTSRFNEDLHLRAW